MESPEDREESQGQGRGADTNGPSAEAATKQPRMWLHTQMLGKQAFFLAFQQHIWLRDWRVSPRDVPGVQSQGLHVHSGLDPAGWGGATPGIQGGDTNYNGGPSSLSFFCFRVWPLLRRKSLLVGGGLTWQRESLPATRTHNTGHSGGCKSHGGPERRLQTCYQSSSRPGGQTGLSHSSVAGVGGPAAVGAVPRPQPRGVASLAPSSRLTLWGADLSATSAPVLRGHRWRAPPVSLSIHRGLTCKPAAFPDLGGLSLQGPQSAWSTGAERGTRVPCALGTATPPPGLQSEVGPMYLCLSQPEDGQKLYDLPASPS